jgi:hypothetical protein
MSSVLPSFNPFYEPVQSERFFERDRLYSAINWTDFRDILGAWERRIDGWYIQPIEVMLNRDLKRWKRWIVMKLTSRPKPGHFAFTVMSVTCLLIDALSQYRFGELSSEGIHFKTFVEGFLPSYGGALPVDLWHYDHKYSVNGKKLTKYSEVLWNGYRCGILHQAHAPLYCGIVPGNSAPQFEATNHAKYGNGASNPNSVIGADCPMANICPEHLFDEVRAFLTGYLRDLGDPNPIHDSAHGLRTLFKKKFSDSFGIDIRASTL